MSGLAEGKEPLPTLAKMWSGERCPYELECACRTSDWCPKAKGRHSQHESDHPMLHLMGCSMADKSCCCRVLDEIEVLADQYLRQANVTEPPVPVNLINLLDITRSIEIRSLSLKAHFGSVWLLDKEWVIQLNINNPPAVNRFTAFHEGFHIVCRNSNLAFSRAGTAYKPLGEHLADYFASSILMPGCFVYNLWPDVQSVPKMATIFSVPTSAVKTRLRRLGVNI